MNTSSMFTIIRAKPSDAEAVAEFVTKATRGRLSVAAESVLDRFSIKGLSLVRNTERQIVGLAGWRAENLIARIDDFLIFPQNLYDTAGQALIDNIEQAARELQCEAAMLFVPMRASPYLTGFFQECGYERIGQEGLPRVWQETIQDAGDRGRYVMLKRLREDLVTQPI